MQINFLLMSCLFFPQIQSSYLKQTVERGDWIYLAFKMNSYTGCGSGFKFF